MPHQPPAVQSQWALNETATGAIAFSRGLLQAATSDNVSPLAIMTCESFGTLIPACPETRLKIEQLARRSHTSHVIKFISAQIGYTKGDSVELLSRSDGGIRFLCLAATFCTMTRHEAAMRIDSLLEATQSRGQLRPTIAQLQSLMGILESKLAVSDFTTNTAGWAIWFSGQLLPFRDDIYRFHASQSLVPERKELQELILLLSETNRLGEEESVVVQAKPPYVPCLIAFIKWLLGSPPFVQLSSGRVLNHQEKPLVILIVLENPPPKRSHEQAVAANVQGLEISTAYYHKKLKNLVIGVDEATFAKPVQGLVDARVWICHLLSSLYNTYPELHVENELVEAVGEGIFFIISTLVDRVVITDPDYNSPFTYSVGSDDPTHSRSMEVNTSSANSAAMQSCFRCVVFPNAQKRLALARELLGGSFALVWLDSVSERKLQPENIRNMMESPPNPTESGDEITMSRAHEFLRLVVELGADLAFLSLFGTDIDSLPMIRTRTFWARGPWVALIVGHWEDVLHNKQTALKCTVSDILHHSATILGHEGFRSSTVVSSGLGQVLYPAIVESTTFVQQESLHLCVLPGFLSMNGMRFKCLREDLNERFPGDFRQPLRGTNGNESSLVPADFVPPQRTDDCATQIRWRIAVYDDMLKGDLILAGSQLCSFSSLLLGMVCQLLLTPPCEHGSDTPAGDLAQHFKFLSTEDYYTGSSIRSEDYVDHRMLISTQRSYALQLIELHRVRELIGRMQLAVLDASKRSLVIDQVGRYIVMHVDGCIRCALQLCLDYDLRLVIS